MKRRKTPSSAVPEPGHEYVHYLRAREILEERLEASSEEIAMWVWFGSTDGGIDAYLNPAPLSEAKSENEQAEAKAPPRFRFQYAGDGDFEYLSLLHHAYFLADDLRTFSPKDRYLTYAQVLERWKNRCGEDDAVALIRAKTQSGDLASAHPLAGGTSEMMGGKNCYPPLNQGMFIRAQIEAVEAECFGAEQASTTSGEPKPKPSWAIINAFLVDQQNNKAWWDQRLRDAKRYLLLESRASPGRGKQPSMWYPDRVAAWLVDKGHMSRKAAARVLRDRFPDCTETAESLESDG